MKFNMIMLNQGISTMQNSATWIQIALSFILKLDIYKDIADNVGKRFDTSVYEVNRPLPTGKNKKVIGLKKDELGGKIMTKFVAFRFKSYLMDDGNSDKKVEGTKKCVIKVILKFNDYKNCLLNNKIILKSQNEAQSEAHDAYTKEINKIASSRHKRLQNIDRITSYSYGTSIGKVCKTELLEYLNIK